MWGSKKPKEPVNTGFMDDLSESQQAMLDYFRNYLKEEKVTEHPMYDDYYLLRFLRARKFDWDKTKLMFENFLKWREEHEADTVLQRFTYPESDAVQQAYPHNYHKTDTLGRPIYIERLGQLKIDKLFEVTTEERLFQHYIYSYECLLLLRYPACTLAAGKKIEQGTTILDLTGGTMKIMNKQVWHLIKMASAIGQDYYPEIMGNMFIVNAPMLFTGVWAVVKGFLDEKTRAKIKILGGGYHKELT